jgi:hypothetical protein
MPSFSLRRTAGVAFAASCLAWAPPAAAQEPPAAEVTVHLKAPRGTELQRLLVDDSWETVCVAPCDRELSTAFVYRVDAPWILSSSSFRLASGTSGETIAVDPGYVGLRIAGTLLAVLGTPVVAVGTVLTAVFLPIWAGSGFAPQTGGDFNLPGLVGVSLGITAVGAVPLVAGILLLRQHTTVRQSPDAPIVPSDASYLVRAPSWERRPEWTPAPTAVGFPLLTGRF